MQPVPDCLHGRAIAEQFGQCVHRSRRSTVANCPPRCSDLSGPIIDGLLGAVAFNGWRRGTGGAAADVPSGVGPAAALVTYLNLHSVLDKLERLLQRYRFVPMREALEAGGNLAHAARS